jgi:hypothetical protein
MIQQTKIAALVGALLASVTFSSIAVAAPQTNQTIAREAGEIRGEGKGHPVIEIKDQLARRGADDDPTEDIGDDHRGGRHSADSLDQLARHGFDDPTDPPEDVGDDHGGRRG